MKPRIAVTLIGVGLLLCAGTCFAQKEAKVPASPAETLLSHARQQGVLWAEGTPPLKLHGELESMGAKGAMVPGEYTVDWVWPGEWREEIRFGSYQLFRYHNKTGYFQKSGLDYRPELIFTLDSMLQIDEALKVKVNETLGEIKTRERGGVEEKCVDVKKKGGTDRLLCFDSAKGVLVSIDYHPSGTENLPDFSRIEYEAFSPIEGKLVPHEMKALKGGKVIGSVKILDAAKVTQINAALYAAPEKTEFWAQCRKLQDAEQLQRPQVQFPDQARLNHEEGTVKLYGVVETDGSVSHVTVIRKASPDLDAAAVSAFTKSKYKPAVCDQAPVRSELTVETNFAIKE